MSPSGIFRSASETLVGVCKRCANIITPESKASVPAVIDAGKCPRKVVKLNYTCVIENFDFFLLDRSIDSPVFSAKTNDGIQWFLKLYPNGNTKANGDYVSVFLYLAPGSKEAVVAKFDINIIGAGKDKVGKPLSSKLELIKCLPGVGWGYEKLIKREDLLKYRRHYLSGDKLILRCEIHYALSGV